jgi:hypothetical protein
MDCDPWYEHETEWHRAWKALVPPERTEVQMGDHRADIVAAKGWVCELQHSSLQPQEIEEREAFYGRMVWVLDASIFLDRLYVMGFYRNGPAFKLKWTWMHQRWRSARKPVYLDLRPKTVGELQGSLKGVFDPRRDNRGRPALRRKPTGPCAFGSADLVRLRTLHANGWGSGEVVDREAFVRSLTGSH